jgi:hypothetical protein
MLSWKEERLGGIDKQKWTTTSKHIRFLKALSLWGETRQGNRLAAL